MITIRQYVKQYFADRSNAVELPATTMPPPPMPVVKPPRQEPYNGYTKDELRAMMVPREDIIFEKLMEEMQRIAVEEGRCYMIHRDDGFNQNPLPSMQQRVFDRLVGKGFECKMSYTRSRAGINPYLRICW